jgi:hypothetical protein
MKLDPLKALKLAQHEWCIYTAHNLTQASLCDYMSMQGQSSPVMKNIRHLRTCLLVYDVSFSVVVYLAKNKDTFGFNYRSFHRISLRSRWQEWKEGTKSTKERPKTKKVYARPAI